MNAVSDGTADDTGEDTEVSTYTRLYDAYITALNETWEELTKQVARAQLPPDRPSGDDDEMSVEELRQAYMRDYRDAVRQAWAAAQASYREAYETFLAGQVDAWASIDTADIDAAALRDIARGLELAAQHADATIGNWSLIEWTGWPRWCLLEEAG